MNEKQKQHRTTCSTCWIHKGLYTLYEDKRLCDVEIHVEDEIFSCHKIVLIAASEYFDTMFSSRMKEACSNVIHIKEVSVDIVRDILTFIYLGEVPISTQNVEPLLHVACRFQINSLKTKCEEFLKVHITPENGVGVWCTAQAYSCETLAKKSFKFLLDNFEDVANNEEILNIDAEDILQLIKDDQLYTEKEETVCRMVLKWIQHDIDRRQRYISIFVPEFRLDQVGMEFILHELFSNEMIRGNETCMDILKSAIMYHSMPDMRHTMSELKNRPRTSSNKKSLTLVLGKRANSDFSEVIGYSTTERKWVTLCTTPIEIGEWFAACPVGNDLYVSGGTKKPTCMYQFSAKLFRWVKKSPMTDRRSKHAMVAVGNNIYALGGYSFYTLESVEEYDMQTDTWTTVGKLTHAVTGASATNIAGSIYIFGGSQGMSEATSITQCYNPITNQCSIVGNLPSPQVCARSLTVDRKTYIVGTGGEVYWFKENNSFEIVNKIENFDKKHFGLYSNKGNMYCLGGQNTDNAENADDSDDDTDTKSKLESGTEIINALENSACSDLFPDHLPVPLEVYCCYKSEIVPKYPLVSFSEDMYYK